jgi:hypothetical protein
VSILADDGGAVASSGHGAARQLLLLRKEDDEGVSRAGPRWASAGREEEQSWARNGPEDRELYFFSKSNFLFVFKLYFADLKLIGGFKLF